MLKLFLIRHGNRPDVAGDPELSELGIKQAQLTATILQDKKISMIFSSPFKRAHGTAKTIANHLQINNVEVDERLKERFNWGDDPAQSFEEFITEWRKTTKNRDYQPSIGDSSRNAGTRLEEFIEELKQNTNNTSVLLVTHGGTIADLLRNLFNDDYLKSFRPDFLEAGIPECSITELTINDNAYILQKFAGADHLPEPIN